MTSSFEQLGPSRPRSVETRQRLLTAAAELIAEAGWGRVTTRAVAERAGLPLGAVSYHFRGKQDLLSQAALATVEAIFPLSELATIQSLVELLGMIKTSVGNRESFDPVVSGMLLETLRESGRDPALRERMVTLLRDYRQLLADLVAREQTRGAVATDLDPAAVASLIAGAGDGLLLHALVDSQLDVTASVETLLTLLSRGGGNAGTGHD